MFETVRNQYYFVKIDVSANALYNTTINAGRLA